MRKSRGYQIIFEDNDIIVVHKEAGTPTQSARATVPDLESMLKVYLKKQNSPSQTSGTPYLAVIHRLDQPVEGLLVFAKNAEAAADLNRQLTNDGFGKIYHALVWGGPKESSGTFTDSLYKENNNHSIVIEPGQEHLQNQLQEYSEERFLESKKAVLNFKVLNPAVSTLNGIAFPSPAALVEIQLETGRHHQIRVQMAHHGCPLVGDRKYGNASLDQALGMRIPLCLCACHLTFLHPKTKEVMDFSITPSWE